MRKGFSIAGRVAYSANMFLKIKTVCLHVIIPEMHSFSMRPAKYFYDNPLPNYLDPITVLIYRPHPVYKIGEIKYTSIYPVVMQSCTKKGKHYVHMAIFYLNKGQVPLDLKDGYLTDLLITHLLMLICLYFTFIYIFPLFISIFSSCFVSSSDSFE